MVTTRVVTARVVTEGGHYQGGTEGGHRQGACHPHGFFMSPIMRWPSDGTDLKMIIQVTRYSPNVESQVFTNLHEKTTVPGSSVEPRILHVKRMCQFVSTLPRLLKCKCASCIPCHKLQMSPTDILE